MAEWGEGVQILSVYRWHVVGLIRDGLSGRGRANIMCTVGTL